MPAGDRCPNSLDCLPEALHPLALDSFFPATCHLPLLSLAIRMTCSSWLLYSIPTPLTPCLLDFSLNATPLQEVFLDSQSQDWTSFLSLCTHNTLHSLQWWLSPLCVRTSCPFFIFHMLRLELLEGRPWSFLCPQCLAQDLAPIETLNICWVEELMNVLLKSRFLKESEGVVVEKYFRGHCLCKMFPSTMFSWNHFSWLLGNNYRMK